MKSLILGLLSLSALLGTAAPATAIDGKLILSSVCAGCHSTDRIQPGSRTQEAWRETVGRMQNLARDSEMAFSDDQLEQVVAYLTAAAPAPPVEGHDETRLKGIGELLGLATGVLVLMMTGAGLCRRRIGKSFRRLHAAGALLLAACLGGHALLLFLGHGPPRSAWHACGSAALACVAAAALCGLSRRRLRKLFLPLHTAFACLGTLLAILHRLIAP